MDVRIETQNVVLPSNSLLGLRRRIARVMRNLSQSIDYLHVTLRDVNGDKGGRDKVCTIRARLLRGGEVVVVDRSSKTPKALFRGLRRARNLVHREIKRRRHRGRRPTPEALTYGV